MKVRDRLYRSEGGLLEFGDDVPSMNAARQPTENGQEDVDEEVGITPGLEEDGHGWKKDGQEVEAHVAG